IAAAYFQQALQLDPASTEAELGLAKATGRQYIPGSQANPKNEAFADRAIAGFERVLAKDSGNIGALVGLPPIHQDRLQLRLAHENYLKIQQLSPFNPIAFYAVAALDWIIAHQKLGPCPVDFCATTPEEQAQYIDEGLRSADVALALNPDYDAAMSYRNL